MYEAIEMYNDYCSVNKAESIAKGVLNSIFFICPRCGMVFERKSKHNYGYCCSFCATDDDREEIEERARLTREQMKELQEEIERRFTNESNI